MFDLRSASANVLQHGVTQSELQEVDAADDVGPGDAPWVVWQRIVTVLLVSAPPWFPTITGAIDSIAAGSRSVLFVVSPILALILILSCPPARGVIDTEVNWIVALLSSAGALATLALLHDRIPTLSQLWRIDMVGPVIFTAGATGVLLGLRYAYALWDVWLLLMVCASPVPFLLVGAVFGGSDAGLAGLACVFATLVVFRAARSCTPVWRSAAALVSLSGGLMASGGILALAPEFQSTLLIAAAVGAGVVPFAVTRVALRLAPGHPQSNPGLPVAKFPDFSPVAVLVVLGLSTVMLMAYPEPPWRAEPPHAAADWTARSGLHATKNYGFAARFLGPHSTVTRYAESQPTLPAAAVDVITTPSWGVLENFTNAQWYESSEPVDYESTTIRGPWGQSLVVRAAHSNADTAVNPEAPQWYALTWTWRIATGYQQVVVVASQHRDGKLPSPEAPSVSQSLLDPMLWIARQQPRQVSEVGPDTIAVAERLARGIIDAAGLGRNRVDT